MNRARRLGLVLLVGVLVFPVLANGDCSGNRISVTLLPDLPRHGLPIQPEGTSSRFKETKSRSTQPYHVLDEYSKTTSYLHRLSEMSDSSMESKKPGSPPEPFSYPRFDDNSGAVRTGASARTP